MKLTNLAAVSLSFMIPVSAFSMNAKIIGSVPVYENYTSVEERCVIETVKNNNEAAVLGSTLIGAALGVALAKSLPYPGRYTKGVNTAILGIGGGALGYNAVKEKEQERCFPEKVVRTNLVGYDVTYIINGRKHTQRLNYDPGVGSTVPVNVTIR
jgi:uncharacterized protein YcfJ